MAVISSSVGKSNVFGVRVVASFTLWWEPWFTQYLELYMAFRIYPRLETMGKTLRPRLSCPSL